MPSVLLCPNMPCPPVSASVPEPQLALSNTEATLFLPNGGHDADGLLDLPPLQKGYESDDEDVDNDDHTPDICTNAVADHSRHPPPAPSTVLSVTPLAARAVRSPSDRKSRTMLSILQRCRAALPRTWSVQKILRTWSKPDRWDEVDESFILSLCSANDDVALDMLRQLKDPKSFISRLGTKCFNVSLGVSLPGPGPFMVVDALIDSGATGCYINQSFVDSHSILTCPLPHPICVYNADLSRNAAAPSATVYC
ncbi:hypothetical protein CVT25_012638 [Psilocybe cyanescens]|uniref:Uncharacterized protein n=1 Tax=Psilocybe cyanescens TaxID=93625 RepID=A0A409XFU9_PSICY|nr:hypothetical protein CVT25_012638 [Psilocybe cyanescens]